jgi:hypothetical protein
MSYKYIARKKDDQILTRVPQEQKYVVEQMEIPFSFLKHEYKILFLTVVQNAI